MGRSIFITHIKILIQTQHENECKFAHFNTVTYKNAMVMYKNAMYKNGFVFAKYF